MESSVSRNPGRRCNGVSKKVRLELLISLKTTDPSCLRLRIERLR